MNLNDTKRKLKTWKSFDFHTTDQNLKKTKRKEENNSEKKRTATSQTKPGVPFNFYKEILPKSQSDLGVHPKKIQEVEDWLKFNILETRKNQSLMLLMSGPTGAGKTTTLKVVCKTLEINIIEWINPIDLDYEYTQESQRTRFLDFISCSKYKSLLTKENHEVTLIKDFPNIFVKSPEKFAEILRDVPCLTRNPIVFICTGDESLRTLFPDNLQNELNIHHITFNPCAATILNNTLKRALNITKLKAPDLKLPSQDTVHAITATSMGDIRNALNQLYLALSNNNDLPMFETIYGNKKRKRKTRDNNNMKIKGMERDENLGLFHGLGRVLNPKRNETNAKLNCDFEKIVDEFSTKPAMFLSFLFENYQKYFGSLKDVEQASQYFSLAEKYLKFYGEKDELISYSLWLSVIGAMVSNKNKISKWNQIRGPAKRVTSNGDKINGLVRYNASEKFYYNMINNKNSVVQ